MQVALRRAVLTTVTCAFAAVALIALPARAVSSAVSHGRVWFPRNVSALRYAHDLGDVAPGHVMEIGLGLRDPSPAGEDALLAEQVVAGSSPPRSPSFACTLTGPRAPPASA
jgi:hypothetical protein